MNNEIEQKIIDLAFTVKCRRKELGMTQRELATVTGLHQPVIARFERFSTSPQRHVPQLNTLMQLISALYLTN